MENLVVKEIENFSVDGVIYWLPADNDDVMTLVNEAITKGEIICMRGAAHSFPLIRTLEANATGKPYKYIMLSKMNTVNINKPNSTVWVQGGCHLGFDPWDPTYNASQETATKYSSRLENSLLYQLDQEGLAIPDLGGITHQTVGGFLSTGSSGGSTHFSFEDALIGIDIICSEGGKATLHSFTRPVPDNPNDPFYAAGVATNGLFGVIVSATFHCVPNFFIAGQEATTLDSVDPNNPFCEVDLFGDGQQRPNIVSLEEFLKQTQYTRLMWWPQKKVNKLVVWKAKQTTLTEGQEWAGIVQKDPPSPPSVPTLKVYQEVPYIDNSPLLATLGADLIFTAMGRWPDWIDNLLADHPVDLAIIKFAVKEGFHDEIFPEITKIFVALNTEKKPPQRFVDRWYTGIPMDNQMSDKLMPVWFTELWIDITKSKEVMKELQDFFKEDEKNAGNFSYEIYAAKENDFWLSPSYKTDVIRIDIFWFGNNNGDPAIFYQRFWTRLAKFNYRPHWGKYLPDGKSAQGWAYLRSNYPKWDDWKKMRKQLDPNQVFLNDYWRGHLGIDENGD